jgi:hypothetical protein
VNVLAARCRCGGEIVRCDEARTVMHTDPECDWFRRLVGGAPHEVREVRQEAVGAHLSALAARAAAERGR